MKRYFLRIQGIAFLMLFLCACSIATPNTADNLEASNDSAPQSTTEKSDKSQSESNESQSSFYVSPTGNDDTGDGSFDNPWQSIIKARDHIRTINNGLHNDIHVYLRGGTYTIDNLIPFSREDSGRNGVLIYYENYKDETPILTGGKVIAGWELYDSARNIYKAKVDASDDFRQLYVNGERAILARTPNITENDTFGPYYLGGRWNYLNQYATDPYPKGPYYFTIDAGTVPDWDGTSPLELVTVDHWRNKVARIQEFENYGTEAVIQLKQPEANNGIFSHGNQYIEPVYTPYYFENSLSLLDDEGEWFLNSSESTIYYKPRIDEDMSTAVVIAPKIDTIIKITEIGEGIVSNLVFKGLVFEYTNWNKPNKYGYANWQAAIGSFMDNNTLLSLPGVIEMKNVDNIRIENCTIRHTGANAIVAGKVWDDSFVTNCVFEGNTINDTSAGGIYLNLNNERSTGNVIQNNLISYGGRQYSDAVGILISCTPETKVLHNEVCYYGYAGIHVGWDWGDAQTTAKDIEVAYNRIHDVMQLLDDAGGIYTLGNIPGGIFHDNYIYNIMKSPYQGSNNRGNPIVAITNDGGSNKEFYRNVIENVEYAFSAINHPNHDNAFHNNFYNANIGFMADENQLVENIFIDGEWPQEAKDIIANAGIDKN